MLADYGFLGVLYPDWLAAIGDEGFAQVCDYFAAVDVAAAEERFFPLEILATGLFIPLLDSVDLSKDHYNKVAARVTADIRSLGMQMDLPKRLINGVIEMLRGQLYLLFFHHMQKRVQRFVDSDWFDPVWQVHQLAFGRMEELAPVREVWMQARRAIRKPIGGHDESPDKRDIFSFRGKTGGGRHDGHGDGGGGGGGGQGRGGRGGRGGQGRGGQGRGRGHNDDDAGEGAGASAMEAEGF